MFVRKRDAAIRAEVALSQPVTVGVRVPEGVLNISKLRPREHGHRVACRDDQLDAQRERPQCTQIILCGIDCSIARSGHSLNLHHNRHDSTATTKLINGA